MGLSVLIASLFVVLVLAQHQNKLAFQIEARAKECFHLEVNKGDEGEGVIEVSVIKGGLLDILIDVFDPHDTKLLSRMFFEGKGGHEMKFPIQQPGDYQICFNNEMARWTSKVVSMRMFISRGNKPSSPQDAQPVTPADVDPLEARLEQLSATLQLISDEQDTFKNREAAHSGALRDTKARVTYYSIFESAVLVALSLLQIYFVKKWFDSPNYTRGSRV